MIAGVTVTDISGRSLDRMSVSRLVLETERDEARAALRPPLLECLCPSARATRIRFEPPGGRLPTNPSICWHREELWCVVRAVNYTMVGRRYTIHDPRGVARTENYLGRLRPDGELVGAKLMGDLDPAPKHPSPSAVGYEDVRLVSVKGKLTGSSTVCGRDPEGRRLIARLHLDARGNVRRADVQPSNQVNEKNWMPLVVGGEFTWIYSLDPTAILPGPLRVCSFALDHLRGGAAIEFGGGYLCVTHETIDIEEGRVYLHRFVRLDEAFNVTAVSPSWVFEHHGIEFACGLAMDGELVLSFGIEDREAWVMRVDAKEVESMEWITT